MSISAVGDANKLKEKAKEGQWDRKEIVAWTAVHKNKRLASRLILVFCQKIDELVQAKSWLEVKHLNIKQRTLRPSEVVFKKNPKYVFLDISVFFCFFSVKNILSNQCLSSTF